MDTNNHSISLNDAAKAFLSHSTIAVVGLSRGEDDTAKTIYTKLKSTGYNVYAIHPTESEVKGIPCYPDLTALPQPVEAVVVITKPIHVQDVLTQAQSAGASWVWLHKSFGNSVDPIAVELGRQKGLNIIDGGCPMMHLEPVDPAHKCMKPVLQWTGRIPRRIPVVAND